MAIVINGTGTIAGVSATGITTAPTNATDASKLPLAGGTLTGNLQVTSDNIAIGSVAGSGAVGNTKGLTIANSAPFVRLFDNVGSGATLADYELYVFNSAFYIYDNIANAERMRISSDGKLSIGANAPESKLTIDNDISTAYSVSGYAGTASNSMLYLNNTNAGSGKASLINFRVGTGDGLLGFVSGSTNVSDFVIATDGGSNGVERLRILNNGNVGIGTTSSAHKLSLGTTDARIHLGYSGTSANIETGRISTNSYNVNNESYSLAEMSFITSSANGYTGGIQFRTNSVNSTNTRADIRMTIDSVGRVGIGTNSPSNKLHVKGTGAEQINLETTGGATTILAIALKNSANTWQIENGRASNVLSFRNSIGGETIRSHANGVTAFNSGIALGVGLNNTASNVLDDYEEGTWTGTLTATSGTPNTAQTATGTYTKVGRLVTVNIDFNNKNTTGASGPIRVTGLPFQVGVNAFGSYIAYNVINYTANSINTSAQFVAGDTYITFVDNKDSGPWETSTIVAGNTMYLYISGTYYV